MKTFIFFGCMVFLMASCVFMLLAKSNSGEITGLTALIISMAVSLRMSIETGHKGGKWPVND